MKKLGPGVYDDEQGGMHLDLAELLAAHGYADTPGNRDMLIKVMREMHGNVTVSDAPITLDDEEEP